MRYLLVSLSLSAVVATAGAAIVGVDHGTSAPPATLGPYTIAPLPYDGRAAYTEVSDAPGSPPLAGDLGFSIPCSLRQVDSSWATWSHDYSGVVYFSNGENSVTIDLPDGTAAFLFYAEPNPLAYFDMTAGSILAPPRMTPVFVRLYNMMHYGRMAGLSAMVLAAVVAPFLIAGVLGASAWAFTRARSHV